MAEVVNINITHNLSSGMVIEKRYPLTQTIASIKENIATHFNTSTDHMRLTLKNAAMQTVETDMKCDKMLGYYQCRTDFTIHVIDTNPTQKYENYDDVSQVEKFELTEEQWLARPNNIRAYKQRMLEQQRAEMEAAGIEVPPEINEDSFKEEAEKMKLGDRCQCQPGDRLGCVRYVGRIAALKPGFYIGVEFDEPVGKSDGSVKGVRVFTCRPQYGGILRPDQVEVGDFPEEEF